LGVVRCFARYLHAIDPEHQVPPPRLVHRGQRRPEPFLYSESDIVALMGAARQLRSPLQAVTIETLIGLLSVTGLRVGEVIRLDRADLAVERGVLVVRNSKAGKTRHVPLHASTTAALSAYLRRRDQLFARASSPALFISTTGTRLRGGNLRTVFVVLLERAGLPPRRQRLGPRLGALRHSFAVQTLLDWYATDVDVGARLPVLSMYLGHVSPASTYWYLSASPPLLAAAARRLDRTWQELP
jgi:integrase